MMNYKALAKKAQAARKYSHSPYSKFRVGAALLTSSGKVFTGCNIENSSFSLTICAERTAFFKAISEGHKRFKAIAISSDSSEFIPPCGSCRQVIMDFGPGIDVVLTNSRGSIMTVKAISLLPMPFSNKFLMP
jgi:cytidine deaminase